MCLAFPPTHLNQKLSIIVTILPVKNQGSEKPRDLPKSMQLNMAMGLKPHFCHYTTMLLDFWQWEIHFSYTFCDVFSSKMRLSTRKYL